MTRSAKISIGIFGGSGYGGSELLRILLFHPNIDIAFVTREGTIVKVCATVRPWRIAAAWSAFGVIELPAGTLSSTDTVAGDVVTISASEQV